MATFQRDHNIDKRYVVCPYNRNHRIPANRLAIHLVKCEKQSAEVLLVCPFNACHRLHKHAFEEHISKCKDQMNVFVDEPNNRLPMPGLHSKPIQTIQTNDELEVKCEDAAKQSREYWD